MDTQQTNGENHSSNACISNEPSSEKAFDIDGQVMPEWVDEPRVDTRPGAVLKSMRQYEPETVRWLEPGRIAMGKLTLIAGDPGLGKSFMTLELAARVSRGEIGRRPNCATGRAVVMSAEDDPCDTLQPRLSEMCANLSRVHFLEGMRSLGSEHIDLPRLDRDTDRIIDAIQKLDDVSLVVIDPISAYMGNADSHNNAEVRAVLAQLARMAHVTKAAVVCVTHLNKDSGSGKRAVYRAMGSLAFTAAARTVHMVTKHPKHSDADYQQQDPSVGLKRVVAMVKNNLGPIMPPRVFVIDDGILVWLDDEENFDADDLVTGGGQSQQPAPGSGLVEVTDGSGALFQGGDSQAQLATDLLVEALANGPRSATAIYQQADACGLSKKTLRRAKASMGIVSFKHGRVWYWSRDEQDVSQLVRDAVEPELDENGLPLGHGTY